MPNTCPATGKDAPTDGCKLYFKESTDDIRREFLEVNKETSAVVADTARVVAEIANNQKNQGIVQKETRDSLYGNDGLTGIAGEVHDHRNALKKVDEDIKDLKKLPQELQSMVRSWGFKLVGIYVAGVVAFGALNFFMVKSLLANATKVVAK